MIKQKVSRKILKYFELNDNENITFQNVWDDHMLTHIYGIWKKKGHEEPRGKTGIKTQTY